MRLLYLSADPGVPILGHKGASVHVRALVKAFAEERVEVVVASPRVAFEGDGLQTAATLVSIDPVLPKAHSGEASLREAVQRQAGQIVDLAARLEVDAVYERFSLFSHGGVDAASSLGVLHALEVNAPLRAEAARFRTLPHPALAEAIERDVFGRTDRVFAVSSPLAQLLVPAGVAAEKLEVARNGIDVDTFRPLSPVRDGIFTVGFAGSLKPWHGIDVLLEGFGLALAREPGLRLEVVGSGPLAELVAGSPLPPERLVYHGQLTHRETIRLLAGWDVGAAPFAPLEDFYFSPLKVGEYMAAGACPVASDLPPLRDLLGHGERGVLVEAGNAAAFAHALVELARNRERTAELGRRARAYAFSALDWTQNARRALGALGALAEAAG
jgi:glycosyltransferase involved in cell wall biosynthesis